MKKLFKTIALVAVATLTLTACGGGIGGGVDASGAGIAKLKNEVVSKALKLAEDSEDPAVLAPQIADLKEEYIQKYVAIGAEREKMTAEEKAKLDADAQSEMIRTYDAAEFAKFNDKVNAIRPKDNTLANEMVSLNSLSQYAFYELLKKQNPAEATRLNIQ